MGRKKDRFWEYAEELKDGFKCKFCHEKFHGSISRIKPHLAKVAGRDIKICTEVPENVQRQAFEEVGGPNKKAKGAPSTSDFEKTKITSASSSSPSNALHHLSTLELCTNKDKSAVDKLLAQHVVLNNIPIDVVQTASFSRFVRGVAEYGPDYSLPSDSTLKTKLIPDLRMEVEDYIRKVKESWVTTGCTLILDLWADKKQGDFISIIAYSPKGAVFKKPFEIPNERKEELNLANTVSSVIEEIGPDNVVQFITNARKFESVGDELVLKYPRMYKTRCAAHGIHLLMKDIYKEVGWVKKVIDDATLIVEHMHKNTIISLLMREHTSNKELKRPCMARFASNFLMLQSIFEVENELQSLVASSKWRELGCNKEDMAKRVTIIVESTDFWSQGKEVLEVLTPLVRVLQLAESDGSTIGYLYEAMEKAEGTIKQLCGNNQGKYMRIRELFEESHTLNIIHPIHAAAAFFNPAYMCSENFREDQKMREGIAFILENLVADEEKDDFIGEVQIYRIKESSLFTNIAIRMLKTSHPRIWWDFNGNTLPTLKKYAIRILSQPCSSSSCERNWSAFEVAQTKKRNRLAPELLDNLVYVRINTMMMEKFKMLEAQGTKPIDLDKLNELPEYADHEQDWKDDALDAVDGGFDDDVMNDADPSRLGENSFYQMENIGEYCVSAFLQQLLIKLTSPELQEFVQHEQIRTELCKWKDILWKICAVIDDAEEKQMENSKLKFWLSKLTDLAYDVEDILDGIGTEALRHKLVVESQASLSNIQTLIPADSTALNSSAYGVEDMLTEMMSTEDVVILQHQLMVKPQASSSNIQTLIPERHQLTSEILANGEEDIPEEMGTEDVGIEASRHQLMVEAHASTSNLQTLILGSSSGLNPSALNFDVKMRSEIVEITSRLQEIVKQKDDLKLTERAERRTNKSRGRPSTSSLVYESHVYGREKDREAILELLLRHEASDDVVCVIPIIGMAGVGKTTLAQVVYNDDKVNDYFDLKAWVYVSKEFNVLGILKTILRAVASKIYEYCLDNLDFLQSSLKRHLHGKKFLLVLDDVWNESCDQWYVLRTSFMKAALGSKIVVTTRDESVASNLGSVSPYCLRELSFDDCRSLLTHHALGTELFDGHSNLKVIDEEIVRRCKGLPLAAKTLGCLLCCELNRDVLRDILNSKIWDLSAERCGIIPALRLSYHHLPSHLKQCFAYCAIFPKGYEFDEDELVLLWMAEGFLREPKGKKHMEGLGHQYFLELLSRSFFQQSNANKSRYVMHDLINFLAQSAAGEICFNLEADTDTLGKSPKKVRHLAFNRRQYDVSQRFEVIYQMKSLRTFLALPLLVSSYGGSQYLSNKVLHDLLPKLRYLRALSLTGYEIRELPDSIGDLKHLRYLNLSYSQIRKLPESMSALLNLQTLILRECWELTMLPAGIGNLIELHHLDISNTYKLVEMPSGIGNLTNLQTLPRFTVGKCNGELRVKDLKNLSHLRGQLSIENLNNVVNIQDAKDANLEEKQGLDDLVLNWSDNVFDWESSDDDVVSEQSDDDKVQVLDCLQPHRNLKKLTITSYGGTKFPSWIGDPLFSNLVQLKLCYCSMSTSLPSLGQLPLLKDLRIEGMCAVKTVGPEFYGVVGSTCVNAFPSLESLHFKDMQGWEEWFSCTTDEVKDVFPCLRKLVIQNCPKLNEQLLSRSVALDYPNLFVKLSSLHELEIEKCSVVILTSLVDLNSLTTLKIGDISGLASLDILAQLVALEVVEIENCSGLMCLWEYRANLENLTCLEELVVKRCPRLVSLAGEEGGLLPCNLEDLELEDCDNLWKLPNGLHSLTCIRSLSINRCPKLVSFTATGLPYTLKHLSLNGCEALESLPDGMMIHGCNNNQCFLEELVISQCHSLKSFPRGMLPTTLKKLKIIYCKNLESLPDGMMLDDDNSNNTSQTLEELVIAICPSLKYFPRGVLPTTLKKLEINFCENLESLPEGMMLDDDNSNNASHLKSLEISYCPQLKSLSARMLHNNTSLEVIRISNCLNLRSLPLDCLHRLTHLSELKIKDCSALESFPERMGFCIPNLKSLAIGNCKNLKSLPNEMYNFTSLQKLHVLFCQGIVSFPEGGLPPNLTLLEIFQCKNLKQSMSEWGLYRLSSLKQLMLLSSCPTDNEVSFPDDDCSMLPITLTDICIVGLKNLESISRGIKNLTSLEKLEIMDCPKLRSLPKEGLPASLGCLDISLCYLLEERCLKEKGEYWPIISHIPCVEIDGEIQ